MNWAFAAGVILGILAGASTFLGQVLQKKAVNEIPDSFVHTKYLFLLKQKTWVTGLILYIAVSTVFYMLAEFFIGPVLVPSLMTTGLIVLVIASDSLLKENITIREILAILVLSAGIGFITGSKLIITYEMIALDNHVLIYRSIGFTVAATALWFLFNFLVKKSIKQKAIFKALAAGFPYVLSNFWIAPLYASILAIIHGNNSSVYLVFFILSALILIVTNILGITELQTAYAYGDVTVVAPVQQIPIQIAPFFYYLIFTSTFSISSLLCVSVGITMIVLSGFIMADQYALLARHGN